MSSQRHLSAYAAGVCVCVLPVLSSCAPDHATGVAPPPEVAGVSVALNPHNALSLIVTARLVHADSVRLAYALDGEPEKTTPFVGATDSVTHLVALGLRENATYAIAVEARTAERSTRSAPVTAQTGEPPALIRTLRLTENGQAPAGYTLIVPVYAKTDAGAFAVAFDSAGRLAWYREFAGEGWVVEAKQLPNGHFSAYVGRSFGWQPTTGRYVEFMADGEEAQSFQAAAPRFTDPHEILYTFTGGVVSAVHLLAYDLGTVDLRAAGGLPDAELALHSIVRQSPTGVVEFATRISDHFTIGDWPTPTPSAPDLVHPSSLALDGAGNYIVSLQAMDEIMCIDSRSGAVLWRFGGRHDDFTILDDPLGGFSGQHDVRVLENGHLLFFDNRSHAEPATPRAVEYALDPVARTARMVWEFRPSPALASPIMGSVQRLASGNTFVAFGLARRVTEVSANGIVWSGTLTADGELAPMQLYRALRIGSLYEYVRL